MIVPLVLLVALCMAAVAAHGQTSELGLQVGPPPPIAADSVSARVVGEPGGGSLWYWVVVRYVGGYSLQMVGARANNAPGPGQLTPSRFVRVAWQAMPGAIGYDVLRSNSSTFPLQFGSCGACAVVLGTTDLSVDDTGGLLAPYPPAGIAPSVGGTWAATLNTRDESYPFVNISLMGRSFETLRLAMLSGVWGENDCVKWSAGRLVSAGAACGSGGGGAVWGGITGTLSNQTDLQSALNGKDAVLSFSAPLQRSGNTVSCPSCGGAASYNGVTRDSATQLSIEAGNVQTGNVVSVLPAATAVISGGSGTAFVYTIGSVRYVGHNGLTIACTNCTAQSGITTFPVNSAPHYTWTATSGTWDEGGGVDYRASAVAPAINQGTNVSITWSAGVPTINASGGGLGYALPFKSDALWNPAGSTEYCFGFSGGSYSWGFDCASFAVYYDGFKLMVPAAGTITKFALVAWYGLGTAASGESITAEICVSTANGLGTCYPVTSSMVWNTARASYVLVDSISIPVSAGERLLVKITTPAWSTPPTEVAITGSVYVE